MSKQKMLNNQQIDTINGAFVTGAHICESADLENIPLLSGRCNQ